MCGWKKIRVSGKPLFTESMTGEKLILNINNSKCANTRVCRLSYSKSAILHNIRSLLKGGNINRLCFYAGLIFITL